MFDDANDFNDDDFSLLDTLAKQEGKGNLTDEARARKKGMKQGFIDDDDEGYGGSYGGYRGKGKFIFNRHYVTHSRHSNKKFPPTISFISRYTS